MLGMLFLRLIEVLEHPNFVPIAASTALILTLIRICTNAASQKPCLAIEDIFYKHIATQEKDGNKIIHLILTFYIKNKSKEENVILNAYYCLGRAYHKQDYIIFPGGFHIGGRCSERIDAGVILFNMGNTPIKRHYPLKIGISDENKKVYVTTTSVEIPR